jgi:hypothetical protein
MLTSRSAGSVLPVISSCKPAIRQGAARCAVQRYADGVANSPGRRLETPDRAAVLEEIGRLVFWQIGWSGRRPVGYPL